MDKDKSLKETHELHGRKLILCMCRDRQGIIQTVFLKHKKGQCTFLHLEASKSCINVRSKCTLVLVYTNNIPLYDITSQYRESMTQYKDFSARLVGLSYRLIIFTQNYTNLVLLFPIASKRLQEFVEYLLSLHNINNFT